MSAPDTQEDDHILCALALAMVQAPKASLQDLAKTIGISRSTLYRFCQTREQLIERLLAHGTRMVGQSLHNADLDSAPPLIAFRRLIDSSLKHREITAFLARYWKPEDECPDPTWDAKLDGFFLRGQQAGVFRIDIPAPALTEIYVSLFIGLVEAEANGRVARAGLGDLIERVFLHGTASH